MPTAMQAKLLRVLEEGEVERIGAEKPTAVDVRVVVATHRNLEQLVEAGGFRRDLYHRVVVFPVTLPPLRDAQRRFACAGGAFCAAGVRAEWMEDRGLLCDERLRR